MVSRTWSVRLKTVMGSSAAAASIVSVRIGSPNSMYHLDGNGIAPSGPSSGNVGVTGKYGAPSSPATGGGCPDFLEGSPAPTKEERKESASERKLTGRQPP